MSVESLVLGETLKQNPSFSFGKLEIGLDRLNYNIEKLIKITPQPFKFLKTSGGVLSSAFAEDVLIVEGRPVKPNHEATVKDFNLIFKTVDGTVKIVILNEGGDIETELLVDVNSNINGLGETVLEEGQQLAVVGQSVGGGTGIFTVYCSGITQQVKGFES